MPPRAGFSRDTEAGEIRVAEQGAGRCGISWRGENRDRVEMAAGGSIGLCRGPKAGKLQYRYLSPVLFPPTASIPVALG